ncbi:MAG: hypothetical protein NZ741_13490, partial [Armatimonadetes bacterium]|nr:hypothetical protein [Armatimonadota bacterium]
LVWPSTPFQSLIGRLVTMVLGTTANAPITMFQSLIGRLVTCWMRSPSEWKPILVSIPHR